MVDALRFRHMSGKEDHGMDNRASHDLYLKTRRTYFVKKNRVNHIRYISFSTGSCGNCAYLGTEEAGIILDAGISCRRIRHCLEEAGIDRRSIKAVIITHDHVDHASSAGRVSRTLECPVWALRETMDGIMENPCIKLKPNGELYHEVIPGTTQEIPETDFRITPFRVPHDAHGNAGYTITAPDFSFCIVTDCGTVTGEILQHLSEAENVVLESDYDAELLEVSPYPEFLRKRIRGPYGHMENSECASVLKHIVMQGKARRIFLCHISGETNTPTRSYSTAVSALRECGSDIDPVVLPRGTVSDTFILR